LNAVSPLSTGPLDARHAGGKDRAHGIIHPQIAAALTR
jgi:hypothetical protein